MSRPTIRILVVEDNRAWNDALCEMYRRLFDKIGPVDVMAAHNGLEAMRLIRQSVYDLLSCDINLSEAGPGKEADGRTIIRTASERRHAHALVVPTGMASDEFLYVVIPEKTELARLTLNAMLEEYFPGRHYRLDKSKDATPAETTEIWLEKYRDIIVALVGRWPSVRPPYVLDVEGTDYDPRITIRDARNSSRYFVEGAADSRFFFEIANHKRYGEALADDTVDAIYGSGAPVSVASLERRLARAGVDPDALFERVRKKGWTLKSSVEIHHPGRRATDRFDADPDYEADSRLDPEARLIRREEADGDE
jgi:CheY-like chemotaxis protein